MTTISGAELFLTMSLCLHLSLQMAPILAKTSPTFNVFLYALGNENYRGGIWQFLTGEKIDVPQIENKSK